MKIQDAIIAIHFYPYHFEDNEIEFNVKESVDISSILTDDVKCPKFIFDNQTKRKSETTFPEKYKSSLDEKSLGEFCDKHFTCAQFYIAKWEQLPPKCLLYENIMKPKFNGMTLAMTWIMFCKSLPPKEILHDAKVQDKILGKTMAMYWIQYVGTVPPKKIMHDPYFSIRKTNQSSLHTLQDYWKKYVGNEIPKEIAVDPELYELSTMSVNGWNKNKFMHELSRYKKTYQNIYIDTISAYDKHKLDEEIMRDELARESKEMSMTQSHVDKEYCYINNYYDNEYDSIRKSDNMKSNIKSSNMNMIHRPTYQQNNFSNRYGNGSFKGSYSKRY